MTLPAATDWTGWAARYRGDLLDDTLPFWFPRCLDREHGGFLLCRDRDGGLIDEDKGMWSQARATWMLGRLFNTVERRADWLEGLRHGVAFLDRHGFDPVDGRMWFHVARDGTPVRKRRYAFTESFAAIAFAEFAAATGDGAAADRAVELCERFVAHGRDPVGVEPKFTRHRPSKGLALPMIAIVTAQELRRAIGWDGADALIDACVAEIGRDFFHPELGAVLEQVTPDGELIDHFDGRTLNPGHAIEAAWFLLREADERGRDGYRDLGVAMLDAMWARGFDTDHGGILYFVDVKGLPVQEYWHDMKFWWPQCEALLACLYAHLLTGEQRFAARHAALAAWCERRFADREHGEWFGYLHRDGSVASTAKGNLWKGPFHLPRMQLFAWRLCERLAADGAS